MIVVIDNYDSFTFNLVQMLERLGRDCCVLRNDEVTVDDVMASRPEAIVVSPGPCTPGEAGISVDLIRAATGRIPVLGVCLGHQAIGQAFGAVVERAPHPVHGKVWPILHGGTGLFAGLKSPLRATRYHSLHVARAGMPDDLVVTAHTADGIVMGLRHRRDPTVGVQFHPESFGSEDGAALVRNFLAMASGFAHRGSDTVGRSPVEDGAAEPASEPTRA